MELNDGRKKPRALTSGLGFTGLRVFSTRPFVHLSEKSPNEKAQIRHRSTEVQEDHEETTQGTLQHVKPPVIGHNPYKSLQHRYSTPQSDSSSSNSGVSTSTGGPSCPWESTGSSPGRSAPLNPYILLPPSIHWPPLLHIAEDFNRLEHKHRPRGFHLGL